jgi:hypothetical protein
MLKEQAEEIEETHKKLKRDCSEIQRIRGTTQGRHQRLPYIHPKRKYDQGHVQQIVGTVVEMMLDISANVGQRFVGQVRCET